MVVRRSGTPSAGARDPHVTERRERFQRLQRFQRLTRRSSGRRRLQGGDADDGTDGARVHLGGAALARAARPVVADGGRHVDDGHRDGVGGGGRRRRRRQRVVEAGARLRLARVVARDVVARVRRQRPVRHRRLAVVLVRLRHQSVLLQKRREKVSKRSQS